jgi:hypothetical protein
MMVSLEMKAFFVGDAADKGASMVYKVKVVNLIDALPFKGVCYGETD